MHTNDVHARVLQIDDFDQACSADNYKLGNCFGGAARRVTLINKLRGENPNHLLLDAGDQFQGTSFYSTYKGFEASLFTHLTR